MIPLRKGRVQPETPIKRSTPEWAALYRRRTSVEREFGRLKHEYGLAFLRLRGIERVRLHADLTMLGRLSLAVARAQAVPLAAAYPLFSPLMDGLQNDPTHPAFSPRPPLWLSLAKGAIGVLILLGLLTYALVS